MATNERPKLKRIEDLGFGEFDVAYSLGRTGWSCAEIGRRYGISESDVKKLVDNYVELRKLCKAKPLGQNQQVSPEPAPTTKMPRKRRSDAIYATAKERQAAYRARLKERSHAVPEQPSPATVTDIESPANEKLSVPAGQESVIEAEPQKPDP